MIPRARRWAFALTAALAAVACGDREPTAPRKLADSESGAALSRRAAPDVVGILRRTQTLPRSLSATAVIGPAGGTLEIGRAGLRVDFAPGAVATPTRITVTAIRGRVVAYRFAPHGLAFAAPVTIRQSLRHTAAATNPVLAARLDGAYFDRLLTDETETFARSEEHRPARLRDSAQFLEFGIEHFSGYMVSTGKASVEVEVEVEIDTH